jgi:hypothetical protein
MVELEYEIYLINNVDQAQLPEETISILHAKYELLQILTIKKIQSLFIAVQIESMGFKKVDMPTNKCKEIGLRYAIVMLTDMQSNLKALEELNSAKVKLIYEKAEAVLLSLKT